MLEGEDGSISPTIFNETDLTVEFWMGAKISLRDQFH